MVATGNRPPYGVRFLPEKSQGVEAPILLGSGCAPPEPCFTGSFSLCCVLFVTIWVTPPWGWPAKLVTPQVSVSPNDNGVPKWFGFRLVSASCLLPCIDQVLQVLVRKISPGLTGIASIPVSYTHL